MTHLRNLNFILNAAALRNTLIVRTDRIGDVLLTLPMAGAVKRRAPGARVTFLVREYTKPLLFAHPDIDEVFAVRDENELPVHLSEIQSKNFSAVFCPSPSLLIARTMKRALIPVRVGSAYRGYAGLFTHRIAEHRSDAKRHETQYNIRMIDRAAEPTPESDPSRIVVSPAAREKVAQWCVEHGINDDRPMIIVHPGSGGSARDLPPEHFAKVIALLSFEHHAQIVLTGIDRERSLIQTVKSMAGVGTAEAIGLPLDVLAALVERAACVISNSTGVLHIAAAVGTFAVGMYPPIVACSPRRWGPWTAHAAIFEPPVEEPCGDCASPSCINYDCMRMISPNEIVDAVSMSVFAVS